MFIIRFKLISSNLVDLLFVAAGHCAARASSRQDINEITSSGVWNFS